MNISEPFIRRPVMTVLLTITVIVFGSYAYLQLPVNDLPAADYPVIQVNVNYPGASPQTMASNCAIPLERQFMQISGLDMVTSQSKQGVTQFVLQFTLTKSLDSAATDVQTAINQAQGSLPADLPTPPVMYKTNPNDSPIMYFALTSESMTRGKLYDYATSEVSQQISILPGVSRVDVYGVQSATRIKVDTKKLAARNLSISDLSTLVQSGTAYQGAGQLDSSTETIILQPKGQLETPEEYSNLIVAMQNNAPVYLRDVATVIESVEDERSDMRFWAADIGTPSATVVMAVSRQAGANTIAVAQSIRDLFPKIRQELPPSIQMTLITDRSETIIASVQDVKETLGIAFVLVVIVIFLFLGRLRDTFIPIVALPLSLLMTFGAMWALNYSIDNLSLLALTLAIGFLIDDAIVFLENTVRRMEHGEPVLEATLNSAKEISSTIVSMTISLAIVFLPLVLMPGLMGRIFREFSNVIVISIIASGLVSLTLTPMMCSRILAHHGSGKKPWLERVAMGIEKFILGLYGRSLTWALKHHWISAIVWLASLYGTVFFLNILPKTFLPTGDSGFIWGMMIAPERTSHLKMREYQTKAEAILHNNPAVGATFTMTGNGSHFTYNQGLVLAFLKDRDKRKPISEVAMELTGACFMTTPGPIWIYQPQPVLEISTGASDSRNCDISYALSGVDGDEVYRVANELLTEFRKNGNHLFVMVMNDLYDKMPNLEIEILRDQASTYGVSVQRIESLLSTSFSQNYIYLIKKATDQYQLIMEAQDDRRQYSDDLKDLYINSDDGQRTIPLSAVVQWKKTTGPQVVNHINQFTSVTFSFNLKPGAAIGDATDFINATAAKLVPGTVKAQMQGSAQTFEDTIGSLAILMGVAVFLIYVVLGVLYESYLHPITVLSSLPVALVGGLATLWVFGQEASLYAYVGMFMLMGIVKKNGIMIVDFAQQRIVKGEPAYKAIHDASMDRFRPIMMTTMAAIMGAMPLALGYGADGDSRRPLGLIVVGGLIVSQFITLYVTPVIYLYLEIVQEKVLNKTEFFRSTYLRAESTLGQSGDHE